MKRLVFQLLACLCSLIGFSQDPNLQLVNPLPVSPQAAAITKFTDIPVSLNSGLVNITIPITQIKTGEINFPISLSYNASGIKIEEIASNVGLGWALNCVGSITRQVRGLPDEGTNGWFSDSSNVQKYLRNEMTYIQQEGFLTDFRTGTFDGQPDIYYYNLPGSESGKFFLDTGNHWVCAPKTNLKLEISDSLNSWKITSDQGIQYFFSAVEYTSTSTTTITNGNGIDGGDFNGNTAWYVTKIVDPAGNEVDFTYTNTLANYTNKAIETYKVNYFSQGDGLNDLWTKTYTNNEIAGKKIKSVRWRDGQVNFYYAGSARKDISSTDSALDRVDILNNQHQLVNAYQFYTSYFSNSLSSTAPIGDSTLSWRLRLDSVQQFGTGVSLPPYVFDYNSLALEDRLSDDQDYWGYFNGKSNTTFVSYSTSPASGSPKLGADRSVDTTYTQADMLQRIHYPTGGSTLFEYENNKFAQYQSDTTFKYSGAAFGGISGSNGDHSDPNQYAYDFDSTFTITSPNATYDGTAVVLSQMDSACEVPGSDYCILTVKLYNPDGSLNRSLKASDTLYLPAGTYTLRGHIETEFGAGSPGMEGYYSYFNESLYLGGVQLPGYYDQLAGGVRVKRMTTSDGYKVTGIKEFTYNTFGKNYSSGSIGDNNNLPQYYRPETDNLGDEISGPLAYAYYCYSSSSNYPLTTSGSSYVTYGNVESIQQDSTGRPNGKSDFYYTSFADHPDGNDALTFPFPPPCSFDWQRGLLIRQDDFRSNADGSFALLKQKMNNYTFLGDSTLQGVEGLVAGVVTVFTRALYNDTVVNSGYVLSPFATTAQVFYLQSDTTVLYDMIDSTKKIVKINTFDYNSNPILLKTQLTTASNGDIKKTSIRYAGDFSPYGFITAMQGANDIGTPIQVVSSRIKPSNQELVTGGVITSYKPDQLTKDKIYTIQAGRDVPISQFHNATINSSGILQMDSTYRLFLQFNRYDTLGNIVEEQKTSDMLMSYLWDYAHTAPIAVVKNGDSASIAYTSFEADGTGNWSIGSGSVDTITSITGRNSYNLTGSISKSGLNTSTTYIVSYWSQNGPYSVSGTMAGYPMQGKTIAYFSPNWTFYVHKVTGQSTITLSGTGHIDELRLYPATAQMTTFTYDPLIGMTSQTDAGNRITYYEYDGLARLKRIRDQDYNILKSFDYQYQASSGCGSGCYVLGMQTFAGSATLSYPVGVFDVHGKLIGNASNADGYVAQWNSDTADSRLGTLSKGADSMHFNIAMNAGQNSPGAVTGCRYYQWDIPWTNLDGMWPGIGAYVDWGDGSGMRIPKDGGDTADMDDSTHLLLGAFLVHNYPDSSLKTITIYHNDGAERVGLDNANNPATSLNRVRHLRGNFPQHTSYAKFSSMQQASALTMDSIYNWNTITSLDTLNLNSGDNGLTQCENLSFAQDFMENNRGLQQITTGYGGYSSGVYDTTFKISRLKSDWNTYFTQLSYLIICDDNWNREDLSALKHLQTFELASGNRAGHSSYSTIPAYVSDNILNQLVSGAGQNVNNGLVAIYSNGGGRTSASDSAVSFLKGKGWVIYMDGVIQ